MRSLTTAAGAALALLALGAPAPAQQAPRPGPSLDSLVGAWVLTGAVHNAPTTHDVTAEWILNREYLRIHEVSRERDSTGAPAYEATVLIGWDPATREYICMWLDVTGGGGLVGWNLARGRPAGDSIPFVWHYPDGTRFHNTFRYSSAASTWQWIMDNDADGRLQPFARLTLRRGGPVVPSDAVTRVNDQLTWTPYPAGGMQAFLLGDPGRPGTYVVRIRLPAGLHLAPHSHPDGRIVQVLSGTMYFAYGASGDTTAMRAFPAGSMWTEPPGVVHYAWARDGEVVLQIVGTGPSGSRPAGAHPE